MPVGHGSKRSGRPELAAYAVGAMLGGATTATLLWFGSIFIAPLPVGARHAAIALVVVASLVHDLGIRRLPLPQNPRQVPRAVFANGALRGFSQFGYEMGTGVRTYLTTATPYVLAALLLFLHPSYPNAVVAGMGFGAGRALMPAFRRWSGAPWAWDDDLKRRLEFVVPAGVLVMAVAAAMTTIF